ncbi:MAG: chromosome segregation protein SMC [Acidobacteria bacterium]|nr:chromosome segregation protein SMC [Acidobacteriota bacterium]
MLRLQQIELFGFKSFADRTRISFDGAGIVAIVGPNGCGKSNISDAISWVLGEQSAKQLRSDRMQDVIFNGTPGRKAAGMAEVRLTIVDPEASAAAAASSAEQSPTNGHSGASRPGEILVSRRLFHSGESEYLMNGRLCRLRDIQELFLGTGLGGDSYAIIEQGRIGQILSSKPYERRALIEEAAGVTKFKAKRKLAWAKLEASRQNLARVQDILEEVTRQVNSLKRQASRARRFREMQEEMRRQLRILLTTRFQESEQEAVRVALELSMRNGSLQEQIELIQSRETQQRELHHIAERDETELRRGVEERSGLRLAAERARSQVTSQKQEITHLESRMEEALEEQGQLRSRLEHLESERDLHAASLTEIDTEAEASAGRLQEYESQSQACQNEWKEKQERVGQLRQEMLETVDQCATLRNQVVQLEKFLGETERRIQQEESDCSAAQAECAAASSRQGDLSAGMSRQQAELESITARRASLEEGLRAAREQESRQRTELEQLRAELSGQRARRSSLEEILARRAYSTETVRRLFEKQASAGNGHGTDGQPLAMQEQNNREQNEAAQRRRFEPIGVLADFIEVETAYEHIVEEFLREELDYIVVKDWDSVNEAMHLLRTEIPGRATFLLHSAASSSAPSNGNGTAVAESCESLPGVLGPLEARLRFTNGLSEQVSALLPKLRHSYLVADAQAGRALAQQHQDSYFLTPEGDWFHGALVTTGKADLGGPLALKREFREITRSLAEREQTLARTSEEMARTTEEIDRLQAAVQSLAQEQGEAEKRVVVAERDWKQTREEMERAAERLSLFTLEVERLRREVERARQQHAQDAQEISLREQRRVEIETETGHIARTMADLEVAREQANTNTMEIKSQLAAFQERHRATADALERVERTLKEISGRAEEVSRQWEEWRQRRDSASGENRRLELEAAEAEQRAEQWGVRLAELEKNCEQYRSQLAVLEQEIEQLRRKLEEARNEKTAAEVQLARVESELAHVKEACRNELQMEVEELTAEELPRLNAEELAAADENYRQLKGKIEALGPINMMALEELEESQQRHDFLDLQKQDLLDSIRDTTQAIAEIDTISRKQFLEAFEQINTNFQRTFEILFSGGQGFLRLTDAENIADCGIEIVAQPPGKRLQNVLLLSGGEKALTALALLLGVFRYRPSPFCILDEVDAPLDDANIGRFTNLLEEMSGETQFLIITHSRKTMRVARVLYGVTMEEAGVSKIVSVQFNGAAALPVPEQKALAAVR